jgi:hypothetical protein
MAVSGMSVRPNNRQELAELGHPRMSAFAPFLPVPNGSNQALKLNCSQPLELDNCS